MSKVILMVFLAIISSSAVAEDCEEDSIQTVSSDGSVLIMLSGAVYQVDESDQVDTQLWLAADDVLICDDEEIINKDESAEKASVKRLE
ncbi:MAG: hypothetical protein WA435_00525 [Gallionellaceae bacterium]